MWVDALHVKKTSITWPKQKFQTYKLEVELNWYFLDNVCKR